jgi:two-component system cell cycle response regulator DivK
MSQIVIIEDNAQSARLAERILTRAGHDVKIADNGEVGLSLIMDGQPDVVLIDLGLPDIDGQTVIALLRQYEQFKTLPIIAFTAWPEQSARSMAVAYGFDGVITKPIDTRRFAEQVALYTHPTQP